MIQIERHNNKFRLKLKTGIQGDRGFQTTADTINEICKAISHYYQPGPHHHGTDRDCPLCRDERKETDYA